mmetsp:Transcript_51553/g.112224  ORF Transcript_51553/g.112224 Transcript_51553/m.112224 type:complete len:339 (-) Transcript_51553:662-1678(-)
MREEVAVDNHLSSKVVGDHARLRPVPDREERIVPVARSEVPIVTVRELVGQLERVDVDVERVLVDANHVQVDDAAQLYARRDLVLLVLKHLVVQVRRGAQDPVEATRRLGVRQVDQVARARDREGRQRARDLALVSRHDGKQFRLEVELERVALPQLGLELPRARRAVDEPVSTVAGPHEAAHKVARRLVQIDAVLGEQLRRAAADDGADRHVDRREEHAHPVPPIRRDLELRLVLPVHEENVEAIAALRAPVPVLTVCVGAARCEAIGLVHAGIHLHQLAVHMEDHHYKLLEILNLLRKVAWRVVYDEHACRAAAGVQRCRAVEVRVVPVSPWHMDF